MAYEYIKRMYPVTPNVGARVRHHVTKQEGTIRRENPSAGHYVQVLFDGEKHPVPCHLTEMDYLVDLDDGDHGRPGAY